jgi:hypothetical protein
MTLAQLSSDVKAKGDAESFFVDRVICPNDGREVALLSNAGLRLCGASFSGSMTRCPGPAEAARFQREQEEAGKRAPVAPKRTRKAGDSE